MIKWELHNRGVAASKIQARSDQFCLDKSTWLHHRWLLEFWFMNISEEWSAVVNGHGLCRHYMRWPPNVWLSCILSYYLILTTSLQLKSYKCIILTSYFLSYSYTRWKHHVWILKLYNQGSKLVHTCNNNNYYYENYFYTKLCKIRWHGMYILVFWINNNSFDTKNQTETLLWLTNNNTINTKYFQSEIKLVTYFRL